MLKITRQGDNVFQVTKEDGNSVTFTKQDLQTQMDSVDGNAFDGGGPKLDPIDAMAFVKLAHAIARDYAIEHHLIEA